MIPKLLLSLGVYLCLATVITGQEASREIEFVGRVIAISPGPVTVSGDLPSYRLVKYRILKMISGNYSPSEIVVDHPIITGKELRTVKVGKYLKVAVLPSETIDLRINADGLRDSTETVELFYIARRAVKTSRPK